MASSTANRIKRTADGAIIFPDDPRYSSLHERSPEVKLSSQTTSTEVKSSPKPTSRLPQQSSRLEAEEDDDRSALLQQAWNECIFEGFVLDELTMTCNEINDQGPCRVGYWFVIDRELNKRKV